MRPALFTLPARPSKFAATTIPSASVALKSMINSTFVDCQRSHVANGLRPVNAACCMAMVRRQARMILIRTDEACNDMRGISWGKVFRPSKGVTMRNLLLTLIVVAFSAGSAFAGDDFPGTYKLVSATRTVVATGETKDAYGKNPKGYIMYGQDGRMLVLVTHDGRSKPSRTDMTDQDRADQYRTMNTYGGTYAFHGDSVEHHIDIAGNETRVGSTEIRAVKRNGNRLIYTTKPQPFSADGKLSVITLVWEKLK